MLTQRSMAALTSDESQGILVSSQFLLQINMQLSTTGTIAGTNKLIELFLVFADQI